MASSSQHVYCLGIMILLPDAPLCCVLLLVCN